MKVPGGPDGGRLGQLYGNGYQQVVTQILVETNPEDGVGYPLSVIENRRACWGTTVPGCVFAVMAGYSGWVERALAVVGVRGFMTGTPIFNR